VLNEQFTGLRCRYATIAYTVLLNFEFYRSELFRLTGSIFILVAQLVILVVGTSYELAAELARRPTPWRYS